MKDLQNECSRDGSASQHRHRALHLQQLGRNNDALAAYRDALAHDPDNAVLLRSLAHCQMESEHERDQAISTIERAIQLDPYDATSHALYSLIYSNNEQPQEAIPPAEQAIALAPDDPLGYATLARAHLAAEAWGKAESVAKQALARDPEHTMAANTLTHALFRQGKQAENQVYLSGMLHRDPEDPYTHLSAGFAALQAGKQTLAEEHFLTALRLDPNMGAAREGLLDSFRARSPIYGAYLKFVFFMMRFSHGKRLQIIIGILVAMWILRATVSAISSTAGVILMAFYAILVVWTHVARAVGSLIIFADQRARQAMRRAERAEAILVGGNIVFGMLFLGVGMIMDWLPLTYLGLILAAVSIPLALTFSNDHPKGRWFYACLAALVFLGLATLPASTFLPILTPSVSFGLSAAVLAFIAGPWLSNFRVWYR